MKYVNHVELEMTAEELRACRNVGQNLLDILARATEPRIYNEQNEDEEDSDCLYRY